MDPTPPFRLQVAGIAVRPRAGGPLREVVEARATEGGWIDGDHGGSARRGMTLLSKETWNVVCGELGAELPWTTRRANVCLSGAEDLMPLVGLRLRLGDLELEILEETRPCAVMDRAFAGLRAALEPRGRGGVYGRVTTGGTFRVGDTIEILEPPPRGRSGDS